MPGPADDAGAHALEVGGRVEHAPAEVMTRTAFAAELEAQAGLLDAVGLADLAHTIVLVEAEAIPRDDGAALLAALLELQGRPTDFTLDPARGDVYTNRETWLRERTAAAGWLGAGRARREAITVGYHIVVRERLLALGEALGETIAALAERAVQDRDALMCDYTYLQPAHVTTFGHYLLGFATPMLRDLARLRNALEHVDRSPAGGGTCAGSRVPQDRARLAALLGFDEVVTHTRDAMWQADGPIECAGLAAAALVNLDRLAEDLMMLGSAEIGIVRLDDAHVRASKIMPQKRNPFALSYVRALANRAIGLVPALAASGRTPSGQMDNRLLAYREVPKVLDEATGATALMAAVVEGLEFKAERARETIARNFVSASDLAEIVALEGNVDYRTAHRIVGRLASRIERDGRRPASVTTDDVASAAQEAGLPVPSLSDEALQRALDPQAGVRVRCGPAHVDAILKEVRAGLGAHKSWQAGVGKRVAHAREALIARARELAAGAP